MDVLISIKPQYVEKIISKEKTYEFRKSIFKKEVNNVIIYATAPEKKIVGSFELEDIVKDTPSNLWDNFSNNAGISKKDFFDYFKGKDVGYALKIGKLDILDEFIDTDCLDDFNAPQSYKYVDKDEFFKNSLTHQRSCYDRN